MNVRLAVVGHRSSQPVAGPGGAPLDLADTTLPASARGADADRLFGALADALREMRVRQRQVPDEATSPLRVGLVATNEHGTALDIETGSTNLRSLDLDAAPDRETVLRELRDLERTLLGDN